MEPDRRERSADVADTPVVVDVPERLREYYRALDGGRVEMAANCFSSSVLYAAPEPGVAEVAPRLVTVGRDALLTRLTQRGLQPYRHELLLCLRRGSSCLVEGSIRRADASPDGSFVASIQLDDDGLVERYLAYAAEPLVEPGPRLASEPPADAMTVLHRYFEELEAGDFVAAAACFSEDVVYSHPPYRHTDNAGEARVEFRGRDALLAGFRRRGRRSFRHRILVCLQRGPSCMLEGVVDGLPGGTTGSFVSSLSLDDAGRIQRYLSFYCEPSVPIGAEDALA
jgi:hypothetical protein